MPDDLTSLRRLRRYQLPRTYADAYVYLQKRQETVQLLAIHQRYFSTKFPAAWSGDQDRLIPWGEKVYSDAELNCLKLIDNELFPFAIDHLLDCAGEGEDGGDEGEDRVGEGERSLAIPLYSYGIDYWDRGLSDFDLGWQMLLVLAEPDLGGDETLSGDVLSILGRAKHAGSLSLVRLDELCQAAEEEPLRALPTAMRMIAHATGNAFLDPTDEMPCEDMCFDLEDVALLAEHWKEAQAMTNQTNALANWLAANPRQHLRKVVNLWNRSRVLS